MVPARDEEALIGACLRALAAQHHLPPEEYEVLLVLDRCTDGTEDRAREVSREHPGLRLSLLYGPGRGAGHARRMGMEEACSRLISLGRAGGLISSTDADTVVAPDWLWRQLEASERGARAIGGRIELADGGASLPADVERWHREQGRARHLEILSGNGGDTSRTEHWQFSGASLSLTAETYREIGGLEPREALEDEYLERVLRQRSIPIERPLDVRVRTSPRLVGRASRGLARDLALASWVEHNTYHRKASDDMEHLLSAKDQPVSVVLPAAADGGEPPALEDLLRLEERGIVDEVILPSSAADGTRHRGEKMETDPMPDFGPVRGPGDLLWRGLSAARGGIVVFLDGELEGLREASLGALLEPLFARQELQMVKGFHAGSGTEGGSGELTELVGRPLINLHAPELAGFVDPLSRNLAARRPLLAALPFPVGTGVHASLLLDAFRLHGTRALAQAAFESHAPAAEPDPEEAYSVMAAISSRTMSDEYREGYAPGALVLPSPGGGRPGFESRRVALEERPALASLEPQTGSGDHPTPVTRG